MKKQYKIALIVGTLSTGGLERVVANYSQLFAQEGHEVEIFMTDDGVAYPYSGQLNIYAINTASFFQKIKKYCQFRTDLRKGKFDFVIDHRVRCNPWTALMWKYFIFHQQRVLYFVHNSNLQHYLQPYHKILSFIFRKDVFICVSQGIEQKINCLFPKLPTQTIYNPVVLPKLNEDESCSQQHVMAIARMTAANVKQVDVLLDCYAQSVLPQKGVKLVILGEGENKSHMEQYAQQLGIAKQVDFKGFVSNPYAYLKNAYCTLLSSKHEGLNMVLLESLRCGTPVVAFDCETGPAEIIQDRSNGLLVDNQNKAAFVQALNEIITDTALYATMKQNAIASVEKFSPRQIMSQWAQLLATLLRKEK